MVWKVVVGGEHLLGIGVEGDEIFDGGVDLFEGVDDDGFIVLMHRDIVVG